MYKSILITGASSGIGQSLAEFYAAPGVTLMLTGRDEKRLHEVRDHCEAKGATVVTKAIDVTDEAAMGAWLLEMDGAYPMDLLIANAGISPGLSALDMKIYKQVFDINLNGVLNTVLPIAQRMLERKRGHVAVVSSMTAYRGFPSSASYCASKSALKSLCETWRIDWAPGNVTVSEICPGFVETRLTAKNSFKMPFLMKPEGAASHIAKGLEKKKAVIAFPWQIFLFMRMLQCLPVFISDFIMSHSPKRDI